MGYHGFLWSVNGVNWNNPAFAANFTDDCITNGQARRNHMDVHAGLHCRKDGVLKPRS